MDLIKKDKQKQEKWIFLKAAQNNAISTNSIQIWSYSAKEQLVVIVRQRWKG